SFNVRVISGVSEFSSLAFFFSSRRRHTRSKRDWSSDVCSSDLTFLVITDLGYVDLVHPVLEVRFERGHVHLGVRPTGHHIGDHVLGDQIFGQLLEVAWQRQQLKRLPDQGLGGPTLTGQTPGRTLVTSPTDLDATLDRFFGSTPRTEHLHGAAAGPGKDETI